MAIWNSDGSSANVQALHDQAQTVDGDTITLPTGTFTWSSGVSFSKALTIQGNGIGATIVMDAVQNPNRLFSFTLVAGKASRLTGIDFRDGGRSPAATEPQGYGGCDGDNTSGATWRVDHCRFDLNGTLCPNTVIGVIDHCQFVLRLPGVSIRHAYWNGDTNAKGDKSWA